MTVEILYNWACKMLIYSDFMLVVLGKNLKELTNHLKYRSKHHLFQIYSFYVYF